MLRRHGMLLRRRSRADADARPKSHGRTDDGGSRDQERSGERAVLRESFSVFRFGGTHFFSERRARVFNI